MSAGIPSELQPAALLSPRSQDLLNKIMALTDPVSLGTWKYMLMCFDTPRPSEKEGAIRDRIIQIAKVLGLDYAVDVAGNIRVRKPASKGHEDSVPVAIQAHLDMVCQKNDGITHNFDVDPILASITDDKQWIKAEGTTLGADDGIGVAAGLAILEDSTAVHGPLELIFTTEEETTMNGAINLAKRPFLNAKVMLNLDSEEDHKICVGCAGGMEHKLFVPVTTCPAVTADGNWSAVSLDVQGFVGGHTGIDIHRGRANALKALARLLTAANAAAAGRIDASGAPAVRLVSLNGGTAVNAIPRSAKATIVIYKDTVFTPQYAVDGKALVRPDQAAAVNAASRGVKGLEAALRGYFKTFVREHAIAEAKGRIGEAGDLGGQDGAEAKAKETELAALTQTSAEASSPAELVITAVDVDAAWLAANRVITPECTQAIADLLLSIPHGVTRTSPDVGGVDTSNAMSLASLASKGPSSSASSAAAAATPAAAAASRHGQCSEDGPAGDHFWVGCFFRSFSDYQLQEVSQRLRALARMAGAQITSGFSYFNGWEPVMDSPLFTSTMAAHRQLFPAHAPPKVYSVHAGLECGPIKNQYPDVHAISIGPLIVGAHSPDEKINIASVVPFFTWTRATLQELAKTSAKEFDARA